MDSQNEEIADLPCAGKLSFESRTKAEGSAVAIKWQRGTRLKVYKCSHCQLWHLASAVKE